MAMRIGRGWYGRRRMPGSRAAVKSRDGLLRTGADDYADGDAAWLDVDWRALQRRLEIDGREVNVLTTLGRRARRSSFIHGLAPPGRSGC